MLVIAVAALGYGVFWLKSPVAPALQKQRLSDGTTLKLCAVSCGMPYIQYDPQSRFRYWFDRTQDRVRIPLPLHSWLPKKMDDMSVHFGALGRKTAVILRSVNPLNESD